MYSFVGVVLGFLKLGSVLVGLKWRCVKFLTTAKITVF